MTRTTTKELALMSVRELNIVQPNESSDRTAAWLTGRRCRVSSPASGRFRHSEREAAPVQKSVDTKRHFWIGGNYSMEASKQRPRISVPQPGVQTIPIDYTASGHVHELPDTSQ